MENMYLTRQEALDAIRVQKLITAIAKRRKELNGDWKPSWREDSFRWFITGKENGPVHYEPRQTNIGSPFGFYKNKEVARIIIEEFRDELNWYFTEYTMSIN